MRKFETCRSRNRFCIVRAGMTMTEVVDCLSDEYGWSRSEAAEPPDAPGYDIVRQKRRD